MLPVHKKELKEFEDIIDANFPRKYKEAMLDEEFAAFFKVVVAFFNYAASFFSIFSGFNVTSPAGVQSLVLPDQRSGCFALASS